MQEEKEDAFNLQQLKILEAEKKAGKWGSAGAGNDEETAEKGDDLVIDVAEVKKELGEAGKDLKMWTARAKSRKEGSAGHDKAKKEMAEAEEAIEAFKTQLRDSKTPTQQMVGKCKRPDKLASRRVELALKVLDAQRGEEAALEKQSWLRRSTSSSLTSTQRLKRTSKSSHVKRTPSSIRRTTRGQKPKICSLVTATVSEINCWIRCWTVAPPSRKVSPSCRPCKREWM